MKRPRSAAKLNSTDQIDVTFGAFELSDFRVPYLVAVLRFQQAAEYLDLVTDDPKYANQDWSVDELFQREISQSRVIEIVSNYLRSQSAQPQFFNSLTIVLSGNDGESVEAPEGDAQFGRSASMGPITVSFDDAAPESNFPRPCSFGRIAWNRDAVHAVAIDGQHRLAAIKELYSSEPDRARKSSISVTFLVFDEALGFKSPDGMAPVEAMRSIFIALNRRAVSVSRARNILLDDLDPQARFVRELFSPSLGFNPTGNTTQDGLPIGEHGEFAKRLPLVLVDWHGETRSKIDQGPYLTSVLALDWIVRKFLASRHPSHSHIPDVSELSPDDDKYWEKLEKSLSSWTDTWDTSLRERFTDAKEHDQPFVLTREDVEDLGREFSSVWGRPLTRLLTTLRPYRSLVDRRFQANSVNPQFAQWYQAKSDLDANEGAREQIKRHYRARLEKIETTLGTEVSLPEYRRLLDGISAEVKRDSVAYLLVGQRALVFTLLDLVQSRTPEEWAHAAGIDYPGPFRDCIQDFYALYMVEALNAFYDADPCLFSRDFSVGAEASGYTTDIPRSFWAGTLVRRDQPDTVDFSEKAAERGSRWFRLMAHLYWCSRANGGLEADEVLEVLNDASVLDDYKLGEELSCAVGDVVGTFDRPSYYVSPMCFLTGMLVDPAHDQKEIAEAAARERIRALVNALPPS